MTSNNKLISDFKHYMGQLESIGTNYAPFNAYGDDQAPFLKWFNAEYAKVMGNYSFETPSISENDRFSDNDLFRITDYSTLDKKKVTALSCPSELKWVALGRCNYPFNPVFYANFSRIGCFSEKYHNKYKGAPKNLILSRWHLKNKHTFSLYTTPLKSENAIISELYEHVYKGLKAKNLVSNFQEYQEFMDYVSDTFLRDDDYTISAFLSQCFIYDSEFNHSGIVYPSVRNKKTFNIAFNKHVVDDLYYFEFKDALDINLHEFQMDAETGAGHIVYEVLAEGVSNNNLQIVWNNQRGGVITSKIIDYFIE
jgi:hypothetical protein